MNFDLKTIITSIKNRKALLLSGFILLGMGSFLCVSAENAPADTAQNKELINQKTAEITALQAQIAKYQADLNAKQKEGKSLKNEIAIYDNNIQKNQLEVSETKANIEKTELEMKDATNTIADDDQSIADSRVALKAFLQELYGYQQQSVLEILMKKNNLSDFFSEVSSLESTQNKVMGMVTKLRQEKTQLAAKNEELAARQDDYAALINIRLEQNDSLSNLKAQKDELLRVTNGQESAYQSMVVQNRKLLPSLQTELRQLQSLGSDIKFDDAISAAKYIGGVTGVRPALLLAILRVESGLGTNVGGGTYKTDMNPSQRPALESIASELGYDPNAMPCSKRPKSNSGWGGAIGPAQMMPITWIGIKAETAQLVKKSVPDPWNLTDAIAAIAVKLSKVQGVTAGSADAEYQAAGIYLAGVNWQKFPYYPQKVMYYADLYEKELNG
jgi:peptidoglycan hydrolase CwlO-like protein